jgi:hypothetical protein
MYDQTSGQVFKEWTTSRTALLPQHERDWSRQRRYHTFRPRGIRGPRSLVDVATNVIADNIGDVTEAHLESVPPKLLWRIWRFLEAR